MATLFDAMLALARELEDVRDGEADSGTTTTLVDDAMAGATAEYLGGTLFLRSGSNSGKAVDVLGHGGNTLDFASLGASAVAAGDKYTVVTRDWPRRVLIESINKALTELTVASWNSTLLTVAEQEEYTLPAGVSNVATVEVATMPAAPFEYQHNRHFDELGGKLRFHTGWAPYLSDYTIRLGYNGPPAELAAATDNLPAGINLARLKWEAAMHAYRWKIKRLGELETGDPTPTLMNEAKAKAEEQREHNLQLVERLPTLGEW